MSVDFSAVRRAAMGLRCVAAFPAALSSLPALPSLRESEELQAATTDSAVSTAIDRLTRRTVVLFIASPPLCDCCARTLTQGTDTRPGDKGRAPHLERLRGPRQERVRADCSPDQTAAGSSSTRRLRVRLESTGMPGPIVVLIAAFLM